MNSEENNKQHKKRNEEQQRTLPPAKDEDGDLVVKRLRTNELEKDVITIGKAQGCNYCIRYITAM